MTPPDVTYASYVSWGGKASEEAFTASLPHAVAAVREIIGFNVPDPWQEDAYVRAVCAAADVDAAYGSSGGIGETMLGFTLGSFSSTFGSLSAGSADLPSPWEKDIKKAVRRELSGSGLLYQGLS